MLKIKENKNLPCLLIVSIFLAGCTAQPLGMFDVRTSMTDTIFLDPCGEKTAFVSIKNTTGYDDFSVESQVKDELQKKGYTIMPRAQDAYFIVSANILKVDFYRDNKNDVLQTLFGALLGAGLGAGIGNVSGGNWTTGAAIGGVTGGVVGSVLKADDTGFFKLITNVQISERSSQPVEIGGDKDYRPSLKQGKYGWKTSKYSHASNFRDYQTDVVSETTQATTFKMALPELMSRLVKSIAGIL